MNKKELPRRRSLNDRLDAELASAESIPVAGINNENPQQAPFTTPGEGRGGPKFTSPAEEVLLVTKKATTIMPKEVFVALQHYCTLHDMPKHRVLYRFLIDGLHNAHVITDEEYRRFQDMAAQLTTTYEKK